MPKKKARSKSASGSVRVSVVHVVIDNIDVCVVAVMMMVLLLLIMMYLSCDFIKLLWMLLHRGKTDDNEDDEDIYAYMFASIYVLYIIIYKWQQRWISTFLYYSRHICFVNGNVQLAKKNLES